MKVSVVIPTFNREKEVSRAIESVVNQTYRNLEIIVVDDYSKDNTRDVVKSVEDERVRYVLNRRSKGAQGARNTGIEVAKGGWIAFLDSDDVWHEKKLIRQVEYINNKSKEVYSVYTDFERKRRGEVFWESNIGKGKLRKGEKFLYSNYLGGFSPFMVRKKAVKEVGGLDESLDAFQDRDVYYRLFKKYNIYKLPENLVTVNLDSQNRISDKDDERLNSSLVFFDKYRSDMEEGGYNLKCCMKADIAQHAALARKWGIFFNNVWYVMISTTYCYEKFLDIGKSLLLKNKYIRSLQIKLNSVLK